MSTPSAPSSASPSPSPSPLSFFVGGFATSSSSSSLPSGGTLLCAGRLEHLGSAATADVLRSALVPHVLPPGFGRVLAALSPSRRTSDAVFATVNEDDEDEDEDEDEGVRVVLHALPDAASRHNASGRPDDLLEFVEEQMKALNASETHIRIVVLLGGAHEAFAAGVAIARALPMYSRKDGRSGVEDAFGGVKVEVALVAASPDVDMKPVNDGVWLSLLTKAADAVRRAARLSDMPCSELHTAALMQHTDDVVHRLRCDQGADVRVHKVVGEQLLQQGFGGLWAVGKAAEHPPALLVLSYTPPGRSQDDDDDEDAVAWVAKGIVYDTGGLSLKDKTMMPGMKRDMSAAAAVLHAFEAAVASGGIGRRVHALLCVAENAIGKLATRPDDVLQLYSRKTVEVNNTDAEGRLVLADGVAFASRHLGVGIIVDMATLTGAQGVATGHRHAALYADNDALERLAIAAGRVSGDLVHPLPFAPEFFANEFRSAVADMKNSVACRSNAQSSCAAEFIRAHLHNRFAGAWLHVDMAFPALRKERGTGFGVALLLHMFHPRLVHMVHS